MTLLPLTLATAGAAAILNVWLMMRIGAVRRAEKIFLGDEDNDNLIRRMRAQANFVETTPFVLILIAAIELSGEAGLWLSYVAGIYILGRIGHAFGMDGGALSKGRMVGTIITILTLLGLGIYAALIAARVI